MATIWQNKEEKPSLEIYWRYYYSVDPDFMKFHETSVPSKYLPPQTSMQIKMQNSNYTVYYLHTAVICTCPKFQNSFNHHAI